MRERLAWEQVWERNGDKVRKFHKNRGLYGFAGGGSGIRTLGTLSRPPNR